MSNTQTSDRSSLIYDPIFKASQWGEDIVISVIWGITHEKDGLRLSRRTKVAGYLVLFDFYWGKNSISSLRVSSELAGALIQQARLPTYGKLRQKAAWKSKFASTHLKQNGSRDNKDSQCQLDTMHKSDISKQSSKETCKKKQHQSNKQNEDTYG